MPVHSSPFPDLQTRLLHRQAAVGTVPRLPGTVIPPVSPTGSRSNSTQVRDPESQLCTVSTFYTL